MIQLEDWGWNPTLASAFEAFEGQGLQPARVIEEQRDAYRVVKESGEDRAQVSGRFRHTALDKAVFPAVGDWVAVEGHAGSAGVIHHVLPRATALLRKEAGGTTTAQVVAANLDVALLVTSLNADLEPRRLERYLAAIWESGASPVLLLSKSDLAADPAVGVETVAQVTLGVPVHVISAMHDADLDVLDAYLQPRSTIALVGSSGVGKSTIVNRLLGEEAQEVRTIRSSDDRGCHTTTARRLLRLPSGALLLDTPGMRELGLWDANEGLDTAFEDVSGLFEDCRFRDCGHVNEPGCAVLAAIDDGRLEFERFESWKKLQREIEFVRRKSSKRALHEDRKANRRQSLDNQARHRFERRLDGRSQ